MEEGGWVEVRKAWACLLGLLVNFNLLTPELICELPNVDGGGGSAGVKDAAEDGGGPAGVVEKWFDIFPNSGRSLIGVWASGVEGRLDE
jgi:hypothetical protein